MANIYMARPKVVGGTPVFEFDFTDPDTSFKELDDFFNRIDLPYNVKINSLGIESTGKFSILQGNWPIEIDHWVSPKFNLIMIAPDGIEVTCMDDLELVFSVESFNG